MQSPFDESCEQQQVRKHRLLYSHHIWRHVGTYIGSKCESSGRVVYPFTVKCPHCGKIIWYHLWLILLLIIFVPIVVLIALTPIGF